MNIDYAVLETDDIRIREASATHEPIYYGDSSRLDILKAAGAAEARIIVITFDNADLAMRIVDHVKNINPSTPVLVRTRDDSHLEKLLTSGATEVIPETHEASLTLISHILLMVEYPTRMIHSIIDKARRDRYKMMKGFYHGQRMGFLDKDSGLADIIHAVRIPEQAWCCNKTLRDMILPYEVKIIEVHRETIVMSAEDNQDLILKPDDVVVLRGLVDQLDPGERYLLRG